MTELAPWELAKDQARAANAVLYDSPRAATLIAIALSPYLPETARPSCWLRRWLAGRSSFRILEALGQPVELSWDRIEYGKLTEAARNRASGATLPANRRPGRQRVIDTHAHLDRDQAPAVLARAREAGVDRVIVVATRIAGAHDALELAEQHEGVYACLGVHPHNAADGDADRLDELRTLLAHERAVAVGETGLDYFRDYAPHDAQQLLFERQLALATELGKPVVIHTRDADEDTLAALVGRDDTVVLHCFSSPALLEPALEHGWYVSFAGNVTYPKAADLREAARRVPRDRLLAETDSPYLAPQPVRGKPNEPANVMHTLATLAEVRGDDAAGLGQQIDANATAAFGL